MNEKRNDVKGEVCPYKFSCECNTEPCNTHYASCGIYQSREVINMRHKIVMRLRDVVWGAS